MSGAMIGESGPEMVVTVNSTSNPDDVVHALRRYMRLNHPVDMRRRAQAKTARKARQRRQWHKVAGS